MQLANLDNEVFFKKVFTNPEVFRAFVRDITGVDMVNAKIETEKTLDRKVSAIRFKLDIYAESEDKRVLIEIQRVDYDYSFDRFLHYFLAALVDLQRSSRNYAFGQDVYTIVVLTAPYVVKDKTGKLLKDDVLVSDLNPRTLLDKVREVYPHRLIFLNPNHIAADTPENIKDWLQFIYESIENPNDPNINFNNPAIQKASVLADLDNMPDSVVEEGKIAESRKITQVIYEEKAREEGKAEGKAEERKSMVVELWQDEMPVPKIAKYTKLTETEIFKIIKEYKNNPKNN